MNDSDVTLDWMQTFVRVAERGSLSAVARELGLGQSTVSRHLRDLESVLGVALLSRTTRRVTITDEGRRFHERCVQILRLVDQARDEVRRGSRGAAGTVRMSCTAALGLRHACRLVFDFQDRHPEIGVDLGLTDERIDLVREGVDVALRLGPLTDSSMVLRRVGQSRRILVAAPRYLEAHGHPTTPEDLARHQCIRMTNIAGSDILSLHGTDGRRHVVPFGGRLRVDHGLAARAAVAAGRGIISAHLWLVDDLVESGEVVRVLDRYSPPAVPVSLLLVPARATVARIRLLVDFLAEALLQLPGVEATASAPA